jgi:FKBP-type peptidyl-prolyl cis-trans isomerase SlyD
MSHTLPAIVDDAVVAMYYTLKNSEGEVLDTNRGGGEALVYMHGRQNIVPGLEKALEGKKKNDYVEVAVAPEEGYGARNEDAVQQVPLSAFPEGAPVEPGARFVARDDQGHSIPTLIVAVEGDQVTVDHNHPLAGETLHFEVTVIGIRESTDEEKAHGHVHGPGGHHH